jgi:hypothetical protein
MFVTSWRLNQITPIKIVTQPTSQSSPKSQREIQETPIEIIESKTKSESTHPEEIQEPTQTEPEQEMVLTKLFSDENILEYLQFRKITYEVFKDIIDNPGQDRILILDLDKKKRAKFELTSNVNIKVIDFYNGKERRYIYIVPKALCPIYKLGRKKCYDTFLDKIINCRRLDETRKIGISEDITAKKFIEGNYDFKWPAFSYIEKGI